MDASKLQVGDAFDLVCGNPLCQVGLHRAVVVQLEGNCLTIVHEKWPGIAIKTEVRGTKLWDIDGSPLEIADIYAGEGLEIVAKYEEYEGIVTDIQQHKFDSLAFELARSAIGEDTIAIALQLIGDNRVATNAAKIQGILKIAGTEPTPKAIVLLGLLLECHSGASNIGLAISMVGADPS